MSIPFSTLKKNMVAFKAVYDIILTWVTITNKTTVHAGYPRGLNSFERERTYAQKLSSRSEKCGMFAEVALTTAGQFSPLIMVILFRSS